MTDMKPPNRASTPHSSGHSGRSASAGKRLAANARALAARAQSMARRQQCWVASKRARLLRLCRRSVSCEHGDGQHHAVGQNGRLATASRRFRRGSTRIAAASTEQAKPWANQVGVGWVIWNIGTTTKERRQLAASGPSRRGPSPGDRGQLQQRQQSHEPSRAMASRIPRPTVMLKASRASFRP
jgi:hypothetical protein